jgi:hypothetical protein
MSAPLLDPLGRTGSDLLLCAGAETFEEALRTADALLLRAVDKAADGTDWMPRLAAEDILADLLRIAAVEVFERLIASHGQTAAACVALAAETARDVAIDHFAWQPRRRSVPPKVRTLVYRRDGYVCVECGQDDVLKLTVDHRTPVHFGGNEDPENLVTRCRNCNSSKGKELRP